MTDIYDQLPSEEDFGSLPKLALAAFAARCGRRVQHLYRWFGEDAMQAALAFAEDPTASKREEIAQIRGDFIRYIKECDYANWTAAAYAMGAAEDAADVAAKALGSGYTIGSITWSARNVLVATVEAARSARIDLAELCAHINHDFALLSQVSLRDTWNDTTRVPPDFFAVHSIFDIHAEPDGKSIITIAGLINDKLIARCQSDPSQLLSMSPRQFEEFVAELFNGFGFDVELTSRTRDGGRDIVAVSHKIVAVKYLVECKRYARDKKVGVGAVRQLHGVTVSEGATKGILATTSCFTAPAVAYTEKHLWQLEGRNLDGLIQWLNCYQSLQLRRLASFSALAGLGHGQETMHNPAAPADRKASLSGR